MFDRDRDGADRRPGAGPAPRRALRPRFEGLEGRQLLTAAIAPIANVNALQGIGVQVPVEAPGGTPNQTFTVSSSNPSIEATVAQGEFLTLNVIHNSSGAGDPAFQGPITFQLFNDLTPLTASRIEQLVQQGFYTGKVFHRVANMFPGANDYIVQGGSVNGNGTGSVNQPGFPFQDEFVQQLAFTNPYQVAMANAGRDTNDSQFFFTTGIPYFLDYGYTVFGQVVSGQNIIQEMTQVARGSDGTTPVSPITITQTSLSGANPNGVIHIDATGAASGQTSSVTVTATDPSTDTTASQTFQVSVVPITTNTGASYQPLPFLSAIPDQNPTVAPGQTYTLQLNGGSATPGAQLTYFVQGGVSTSSSGGTTFTAVQDATASVSSTGLLTVTPTAGFSGDIPLVVGVHDQFLHNGATNVTDPANSDYTFLTLHVTNQSGAVRLVGNTLVVTPQPRTDGGINAITVDQQSGSIVVNVNGAPDPLQPPVADVNQIVVFGSKANDNIVVTPNVDPTIPVTLDGGHGGTNVLQAGSAGTTEHGWFGRTVLQGGPGDDTLIGLKGHVRFVKSAGTDVLFAGAPGHVHLRGRLRIHGPQAGTKQVVFSPPTGTFYKFVGDRLVPLPTPKPPGRLRNNTTESPRPNTRQSSFNAQVGQNRT